jgi:hypothetical protein
MLKVLKNIVFWDMSLYNFVRAGKISREYVRKQKESVLMSAFQKLTKYVGVIIVYCKCAVTGD